jgi:hypothetical protein
VTDRVSQIILLCEDDAHQRLALEYMKRCGINTRDVVPRVGSRMQKGSGKQWVIQEFPRQLHASRQRSSRARTLLVVLVDADEDTVAHREQSLWDRVSSAGYDPRRHDDPIVLLIPRWHVETWIRALLGQAVDEDQQYKVWGFPSRDQMKTAAQTAYQWARENATPGPTCVPSLARALSEWRKIG